MTVRWDRTRVGDREMRIDVGIADRPGAHPGMSVAPIGIAGFCRGGRVSSLTACHEFPTCDNAGHAFQNSIGERDRQRAARASWTGMLAFSAACLERGTAA